MKNRRWPTIWNRYDKTNPNTYPDFGDYLVFLDRKINLKQTYITAVKNIPGDENAQWDIRSINSEVTYWFSLPPELSNSHD